MRIFAISDIHVDFEENWTWLQNLSQHDYTEDVLILAGDIGHTIPLLQGTFEIVSRCFSEVLYVPGNHDLWVRRHDYETSLGKFQAVRDIAIDHGLHLEPMQFGALTIVPLLGWYDYSFGQPANKLRKVWADYKACRWPDDWDENQITQHFISMNEGHLDISNQVVVSFSHFLPRIDIMPVSMPLEHKVLYPVFGSSLLESQIRTLGSQIHIYGHHHLNRRLCTDATVYINNALGYPHEKKITSRKLQCILEI